MSVAFMSVAVCQSPSCQSPSLVSRPRRRRLRGRFRVSRLRVFFSSTLALHRTVTSISSAGGPPSSLICCSCSGDVNVRPYQGGCRPTLQAPVSSTGRLRGLFRVSRFSCNSLSSASAPHAVVSIFSVEGSSSPPFCGSRSGETIVRL